MPPKICTLAAPYQSAVLLTPDGMVAVADGIRRACQIEQSRTSPPALFSTGGERSGAEPANAEPVMGFEPMTPVLPRLCAATAPHGLASENGDVIFGGRWRIRTSAGFRRLIYSQFRLSTPATAHAIAYHARPRLCLAAPSLPLLNNPAEQCAASAASLEPTVGFEPTTSGLQNRCSAVELRRPLPVNQHPALRDRCPVCQRERYYIMRYHH